MALGGQIKDFPSISASTLSQYVGNDATELSAFDIVEAGKPLVAGKRKLAVCDDRWHFAICTACSHRKT